MTQRVADRPLLENPPPHTFKSRMNDAREFALYAALKVLPIDFVSDFGGYLTRKHFENDLPQAIELAKDNLSRLRPEWTDSQVDDAIHSFKENLGRLMAEFSVMHRLHRAKRIRVDPASQKNFESLRDQPALLICLHLGNWEVFGPFFQSIGVKLTTFAIPPDTWAQRVIATTVRERSDVTILPPDRRGIHRAQNVLQTPGPVMLFCDEAQRGVTMAPLFGRPSHRKGNLAIAAWLMRQASCRGMVVHCRRTGKANFNLHASAPFQLPATTQPFKDQVFEDVVTLNSYIEPIVLNNLGQWYFLDDRIEDV
jgi:KDO2-lipid IV(A) lauroyltransferase